MISMQIDFQDADQVRAFLIFLRMRLKIMRDAGRPESVTSAALETAISHIEAQSDQYNPD